MAQRLVHRVRRARPDAVHSGTFFPEASAAVDVRHALAAGARLFKVHVQVGVFSPLDPLLDEAWGVLEDARVPVVAHVGSAPRPGEHTGPRPVAELLRRHPDLMLVVAHLGMSEYHAFADLAETYDGVHLDTTMAATDFTERFAPLPADYPPRLARCGSRSCSAVTSRTSRTRTRTSSRPSTGWGSGTTGCERCCGRTVLG